MAEDDNYAGTQYKSMGLWTEVRVEVQSFDSGPSRTYLTARVMPNNPVGEKAQEVTILLSERDTKRLAIQLLMGVL